MEGQLQRSAQLDDREDDFEFVPSQAHEQDDLSSITSNACETDNDSEAAADDSQTSSNVTLQMPLVDDVSEFMEQATDRMTHDSEDQGEDGIRIRAPPLSYPEEHFDMDDSDIVELPIVYLGPEEHKHAILQKVAAELVEHFTEDVWSSERYSIKRVKDSKVPNVDADSRLSLRVLNDVPWDEAPVLVIHIVGYKKWYSTIPEKPRLETVGADDGMHDSHWRRLRRLGGRGVPYIPLILPDAQIAPLKAFELPRLDHAFLLKSATRSRYTLFTVSDFVRLESKQFSTAMLQCLDAWQESRRPRPPLQTTLTERLCKQITFWGLLQFLLVMSSLIVMSRSFYAGSSQNISPFGNASSNAIAFHQLTETNALIELPLRYRANAAKDMPSVVATVRRDGKLIKSRVQRTVDNLFSLDWPHSEAHGELIVAAQMDSSSTSLRNAYVVQYSAKTPFLQTVSELLREMNIGHLPDVDFKHRVQEITKQVEHSRSYVINVSQHQLDYIRKHTGGLQGTYENAKKKVDMAASNVHRTLSAAPVLAHHAKAQAAKQWRNVGNGVEKLKHLILEHPSSRPKPAVLKSGWIRAPDTKQNKKRGSKQRH